MRSGHEYFVLDIVHRSNSRLGITILGVSHKAKATAATSVAILDHHLFLRYIVRTLFARNR